MLSRQVLLFLFAVAFVESATIQWPFYTINYGIVVVNATVGTPGQFVQLDIDANLAFVNTLELGSTNVEGGNFNPNASSTFQKTGDYTQPYMGYVGLNGTDTFVIDENVVIKSAPFTIYDNSRWWFGSNFGYLGLGHSEDTSYSFVQTVLKTLDEPIVVFTYDQVAYDYSDLISGTLTLGGKPSDCSSNWTRVKEYKKPVDQWNINLDAISTPRQSIKGAGQVFISFTDTELGFPKSFLTNFKREFGVKSDRSIDCNTNAKIKYTIGGYGIVLQGKDLVYESRYGHCYFRGQEIYGNHDYTLPVSVLKNRCLLYDYKNLEVGIADRLSK